MRKRSYPQSYYGILHAVSTRGAQRIPLPTLREAQSRRHDFYRFLNHLALDTTIQGRARAAAASEITISLEQHLDGSADLIIARNSLATALDGRPTFITPPEQDAIRASPPSSDSDYSKRLDRLSRHPKLLEQFLSDTISLDEAERRATLQQNSATTE